MSSSRSDSPNASQSLKIPRVTLKWVEATTPMGREDPEPIYLAAPDPPDRHIVFESQIGPTETDGQKGIFLQVSIPLKLKGMTRNPSIRVHIHPSQLRSLRYTAEDDLPDALQSEMGNLGPVTCISMSLRAPVSLIVPCRPYPPEAQKRTSGRVLDAIQSLGRASQLFVYAAAQEASFAHLDTLCALLAAGHQAVPLPPYMLLSQLYNGLGGRKWGEGEEEKESRPRPLGQAEADLGRSPPSYDELGLGPSIPSTLMPVGPKMKRRRRRMSSDDETPIGVKLPSTKRPDLCASPPWLRRAPESASVPRLEALESLASAQSRQLDQLLGQGGQLDQLSAANQQQEECLRQCNATINQLWAANRQQEERLRQCEATIDQLRAETRQQAERLRETDDSLAAAQLEAESAQFCVQGLELDISAQSDQIEELEDRVKYYLVMQEEGGLVEEVADVVASRMTDNITESVVDIIATRGFSTQNIRLWLNDED